MAQPTRLARPASEVEAQAVQASRGISRGTLTMIISAVALLAAAAGAGVTYYRFVAVEKQRDFTEIGKLEKEKDKLQNEADQLQSAARINKILSEVDSNPASHPKLMAELAKLHSDLY